MNSKERLSAAVSYIPVIGWLYVGLFQQENVLARYHLRQSIGLIIYAIGIFLLWGVAAWILTWIPYMDVIAIALFSLVIAAWTIGLVAWFIGISHAARGRMSALPLFGEMASQLPF
jgi:uncharacterized membrane protein